MAPRDQPWHNAWGGLSGRPKT